MIQTRQIQYVQAIVRNRTMRNAAKELYVSEATISQQVRQLERELGISLFDRSRRALDPTDACWQLLPDFDRFTDARDAIEKHAHELNKPVLKSATFVPTGGHLLCPYCGATVTASNGTVMQICEDAGPKWNRMAKDERQCMKCHQRFTLPSNPFKAESEALR